jgi:hypothetical protein
MQDLHTDFDHQLAISKRLHEFAYGMVEGDIHPVDGGKFSGRHYVFFGLANRVFMTHDAIRLLARNGFVDDGYPLVRTSVEATINAAYVMWVGGDQAAADYVDFHLFRDWKEYEALKEMSPDMAASVAAERVDKMRVAYERVKNRYPRASDWTQVNLFDRALAVDKKVEEESKTKFHEMRFLYNTPWREASHYTHTNAKAIMAAFEPQKPDGTVRIHRQTTKEESARLLDMGNYVMFSLLALVDLQLGKKHVDTYLKLQQEWLRKDN